MLKTVSSITNAIGALNYKGTWNASTNTPTLVSSAGTKGDYYLVSVAGSTTLNGISVWGVGDSVAFNGATWQRLEGGADLEGVNLTVSGTSIFSSGTANGVAFLNASKVLTTGTALTFDGTTLSNDTINNTQLYIGASLGTPILTLFGEATSVPVVGYRGSGGLRFGTVTGGGGAGFSEQMRIAGATGVVTMSAYGVGTATFSAAGVISSVSDETWKIKDGVPVDTDAMLKKLEPGYWYYNDEKKEIFGTDRQLGFYAQNVNAAIGPEAAPTPETITIENQNGIKTTITKQWGYYDRSVLAITVMSLKKALATIELLTARVAQLEN